MPEPDGRPQASAGARAILGAAAATGAATTDPEWSKAMAPTQMIRVDAFGLLPSFFIVLMLILAILGVVAHAAAL